MSMMIRMKHKVMELQQCMFLVLLYSLVVCSLVYPSYSDAQETETSKNLLTNPGFESSTNTSNVPGWDMSGDGFVCDTCGPYGGNALQSGGEPDGGTASQTVDLFDEMTQDQVNAGFEISYGSDIHVDGSNRYLSPCDQAGKGMDCRDSFSITLSITDSNGNLLQEFKHEYNDVSWSGWDTSSYDFTQTIAENNYTSAFATLELWGIDAGYNSCCYGPTTDNTFLNVTYTSQAILDAINVAVDQALDVISDTSATGIDSSFEITVSDTSTGNTIESFDVEVSNDSSGGAPEMAMQSATSTEMPEIQVEMPSMELSSGSTEVAEVQVEAQVEQVEAQVEAQIEAQVEAAEAAPEPEASSEPETSNEPEPESENTQENTQESETENDGNGDSKNDGNEKSKDSEDKEDKKETKQQIATKIVTAIIQKMDNSAASQATQLALMNAIGANYKDTVSLTDNSIWYQSDTIYDAPQLIDPAASLFEGAQSEMMNDLISSQYGR
jgi:hypothetical protein